MTNQRISVHLATRDRATELCLLLSSLRYQTYQDFDVVISDGSVPVPVMNTHFVMSVINRLKLEGHGVAYFAVQIQGVCHNRQTCLEKDPFNNSLILRMDDDTVLEADYIEKLMEGINAGYDLVTGVTPHCASPDVMRETKFLGKFANRITLNEQGDIVEVGDDQPFTYDLPQIIPIHHFRSSALYKRTIHTEGKIDYKLGLSNVGFREESWVSLKAILAGYKLALHTGAKYYHLQTPSGGCRWNNYGELVNIDEQHFRNWVKRKFVEKGNFLKQYEEQQCPK